MLHCASHNTKVPKKTIRACIFFSIVITFVFGTCVWQPIENVELSDSNAAILTRRSLCCSLKRLFFVHDSCGMRLIRIGNKEWTDPAGGYWKDAADGAILFATWRPLNTIADVYLITPNSDFVYHIQIPYTFHVHFFVGNFGIRSEVDVHRQSRTRFLLQTNVIHQSDVVIDFSHAQQR